MTARTLTDLEEADVVFRYSTGWTERQLAERFGVPRPAIQRCLDRHGVARRGQSSNLERRDDVDTAEIVRLRSEGLSWFQIGRAVGMKPSGVRRRYEGWALSGHKLGTEPGGEAGN
jgi:hypothetical protein